MKKLWTWLAGKKTKICSAVATAAGIIAMEGPEEWRTWAKIVAVLFGGGAVISLRAAMPSQQQPQPPKQ